MTHLDYLPALKPGKYLLAVYPGGGVWLQPVESMPEGQAEVLAAFEALRANAVPLISPETSP